MDIFSALAVPTRRKIVEMLAKRGAMTATDISEQFEATPSAISQHLKVLKESGLVKVERQAQQRIYQLNMSAVVEMAEWTSNLNQRLDRLGKFLESQNRKLTKL